MTRILRAASDAQAFLQRQERTAASTAWSFAVAACLALLGLPGEARAQLVRWEIAQGGNGHYYELVKPALTWPAARVAATQRTSPPGYGPGHLATISNASENAFVYTTFFDPVFPVSYGWIGFTDEVVEGEWRWIDGTPGIWQDPDRFATPIQTAYVNWAPGEPNDQGGEDFAGLGWYTAAGSWNDSGPITLNYYVEYEPAGPACGDNIDNDGDGLADFPADPGCSSATDDSERDPSLVCDDGEDDDGDGAIDFPADAGCTGPSDPSEMPECSDGVDNDADGQVDLDDPGCPFAVAQPENPPCDDGIDNDGDGFVDFDDPVCHPSFPYWEQAPCGLGAELAFVVPLLARLARLARRRRGSA